MSRAKIEFRETEDGLRVSAWVGSGLADVYGQLFEAARREDVATSDGWDDLEVGIRTILFGCLWLEATANTCLEKLLLLDPVPRAVGRALWDALARASTLTKLAVIASFANDAAAAETPDRLSDAKALFDLRNRLAHFRERYEVVPGVSPGTTLGDLPLAQLATHLVGPQLQLMTERILKTKRWLDHLGAQSAPGGGHGESARGHNREGG